MATRDFDTTTLEALSALSKMTTDQVHHLKPDEVASYLSHLQDAGMVLASLCSHLLRQNHPNESVASAARNAHAYWLGYMRATVNLDNGNRYDTSMSDTIGSLEEAPLDSEE